VAIKRPDSRTIVVMVAVQAVVGTFTVRDISRRSAEQVRGPRLLWKLWAGTNTFGALVYWLVGRKRS
jgi:hypothetical protein